MRELVYLSEAKLRAFRAEGSVVMDLRTSPPVVFFAEFDAHAIRRLLAALPETDDGEVSRFGADRASGHE